MVCGFGSELAFVCWGLRFIGDVLHYGIVRDDDPAANGDIYVADTHYHRVLIFSAAGEPIGSFGSFGQGDGEFIYPTDIAFSGDGRIFVSEYGGNDRISAFTEDGEFLFSF